MQVDGDLLLVLLLLPTVRPVVKVVEVEVIMEDMAFVWCCVVNSLVVLVRVVVGGVEGGQEVVVVDGPVVEVPVVPHCPVVVVHIVVGVVVAVTKVVVAVVVVVTVWVVVEGRHTQEEGQGEGDQEEQVKCLGQ